MYVALHKILPTSQLQVMMKTQPDLGQTVDRSSPDRHSFVLLVSEAQTPWWVIELEFDGLGIASEAAEEIRFFDQMLLLGRQNSSIFICPPVKANFQSA